MGAYPVIIAEIGLSHDGSLGTAHAYIDAVATTGAQGIKFQTHIASAESSKREPWRKRFSPQDESRYDYWQRTSFSAEQWEGLRAHADEAGLRFLSSAFSVEAVDLLDEVGVSAWKIPSGEVSNIPLLDHIASKGGPVWISSGMSPFAELDFAVSRIRDAGVPVAVFQCTSKYPCPPEDLGLSEIPKLSQRYECPVGFSDHSGTPYAGLGAIALGAQLVEVHVVLSRLQYGPDVSSSITIEELRQLVEGSIVIRTSLDSNYDRDSMAAELEPLRRIFTQSVVTARPVGSDVMLQRDDLAVRKPGDGIPASRLEDLVGRRTKRDLEVGHFLTESDLV